MEAKELDLIKKYGPDNVELQALYDQHCEYERLLDKLEAKTYLSPAQEQEIKQLKKKKLAGKTRLQAILDQCIKAEG